MAVDNRKIAEEVLAAVGGAENVTSATHCMTRLRLNLKDQSVPNDARIKGIKGVLGAQWSGGQYQVIIGQNVPKVYAEAIKLGVDGGGSVDESLDGEKRPFTLKGAGGAVLNYLSKSMISLIPIMLSAAMFRTIAVLMGPGMLNMWAADSQEYLLFNNWLYNAGFYFMPIFLGWSAAKQLGASPQLGMMLGGVLIAPELMDLVASAAETGATTTSVYGIPAALNSYSSTVLPVILCVPVMWQVEKFFKKIVPDMLATVFVPFLTMAVMIPVSLCALAPIGSVLGGALGTVMFGLGNTGGVVTMLSLVVIAAFWEFLVMTGMHQVLLTLGITQLLTAGSDSCVMVAGGIAQFATWGMAFGAFMRLKEKDEKGACLGYALSGIVGGVTEPALYGCGFKYMRALAGMVVGGAVGGALAAFFNVTTYVLGATNILGVVGFVAGGTGNFTMGVVSSLVAFAVAAAVTYFFGFTKEQLAEDAEAAAAAKL
ncbi:PTS transporter subunit EIIC [uncultured Collinsella sp.]|uniref:PTS transporter subunit EIIC n=1 Tax=uncultured Collinsella sp. TaxID=165190 RepID=UPI0025F4986A|nr:PTS transporter subunit EIIC [uncultured Collinsella sp.]